MTNGLAVELYISKEQVLKLLTEEVTHILMAGTVEIVSESHCKWNIEAIGYPSPHDCFLKGRVCPQPCP